MGIDQIVPYGTYATVRRWVQLLKSGRMEILYWITVDCQELTCLTLNTPDKAQSVVKEQQIKRDSILLFCFYFSTKTYIVGTLCKHLGERLPISTAINVFMVKQDRYCKFLVEKLLLWYSDYGRLLITFANSLDPDQDRQDVGPDLDPNCLTLW